MLPISSTKLGHMFLDALPGKKLTESVGLTQHLETGCPKLAIVKFLGIQLFKGNHNITAINMYLEFLIRYNIHLQCHWNCTEVKKKMRVWASKWHPDTLLAKTMPESLPTNINPHTAGSSAYISLLPMLVMGSIKILWCRLLPFTSSLSYNADCKGDLHATYICMHSTEYFEQSLAESTYFT